MWWLLLLPVQLLFVVVSGVRREQRAGLWLWSKFAFALGFAALECTLLIVPIFTIDLNSPRFFPIFVTCAVIAALNFIWMIVVMRRWRLPDGRTSLQAYRDSQNGK